jgi:hypothetical protein
MNKYYVAIEIESNEKSVAEIERQMQSALKNFDIDKIGVIKK